LNRSFYALSKAHHPDLHPEDPDAAKRFIRISEAYTILGTPAKRREYDRDFLPFQSHDAHRPQGSYSSSGPAGGRPASGLSRRRTQFRGPPPSFYRSGGWGEQSTKRQAAQDFTASSAETGSAKPGGGGMGHGQSPGGQIHGEDVRHFDWKEHLRTHENHSRRLRARRRAMEDPTSNSALEEEIERSTLTNLIWVSGVLVIAISVPWIFVDSMLSGGRKKKDSRA
jgi:curved DNA-binding protein CbpA